MQMEQEPHEWMKKKLRREYFEREPLIIECMNARAPISAIFFLTFLLFSIFNECFWSRAKVVRGSV